MMRNGRSKQRLAWFAVLGIAALAPRHGLHAQQVIAAGNDLRQTMDCGGGEAVLRGNDNQVLFTGSCRSLLVEGNGNQLRADLRRSAPVTVRGNDNAVSYRMNGDAEAKVELAGTNNDVRPVAGSPAPPRREAAASEPGDALALREENAHRTVDCTGRAVLIEGNGNDYTLRGGCRSLTVRGEGLRIRAQIMPGSRISVQGNGNTVSWSLSADGPEPSTSVDGEGSRISRSSTTVDHASSSAVYAAAPPAPPPIRIAEPIVAPKIMVPSSPKAERLTQRDAPLPTLKGKLLITGDHEARDLDCAGRDVKLDGNFELIVLRGGCRSITVKGDSNKLQAEILPGAHITVTGAVNALAYVILGGGADAIASTNGQNDRIRRVAALGNAGH